MSSFGPSKPHTTPLDDLHLYVVFLVYENNRYLIQSDPRLLVNFSHRTHVLLQNLKEWSGRCRRTNGFSVKVGQYLCGTDLDV